MTAISISFTDDFPLDLDDVRWGLAAPVEISTYWSGERAPASRHFTVCTLWSETAFYVRFDASQAEPLVVSDGPEVRTKTHGLWERDVCEVFIAPNLARANRYFEFEIAPTGEWLDLGITIEARGTRTTDLGYNSNMETAARIETGKVVMAIRIPFASLNQVPKVGDIWSGNIFRCVGTGADRGYLAWRPTRTPTPAFHVPDAFGQFNFRG